MSFLSVQKEFSRNWSRAFRQEQSNTTLYPPRVKLNHMTDEEWGKVDSWLSRMFKTKAVFNYNYYSASDGKETGAYPGIAPLLLLLGKS